MSEHSEVLYAVADRVATITLNRPERMNTISPRMLSELTQFLLDADADPEVRVVVLAGAGKAFCAGHDLRQMQAKASPEYFRWLFGECARIMEQIRTLPQPVIARVQGIATAGGCQLVAACDLAVAADTARFAASGINIGLFCGTPAVPMTRNMGQKQAFEMLFSGEFIDAAGALERGLVNRVVPLDQLDETIVAVAAGIVAKPAPVVALGKSLFYRQQEMGIAGAYQLAVEAMTANLQLADTQEGIAAFLQKRKPAWGAD